ncbi:MAG TPA: molybdopterin molybdenumtransferase MoeA, partial [Dongiaceae bacterium]
ALVTSILFVRPAIARMLGQSTDDKFDHALAGRDLAANDQRQDYLRATLHRDEHGAEIATPFSLQDSSMISLLAKADALVIRPPHAAAVKAGDHVDIIRLAGSAVSI